MVTVVAHSAPLTRFVSRTDSRGLRASVRVRDGYRSTLLFAGAIVCHRCAGDYAALGTEGPALAPAVLGLLSVSAATALTLCM